MSLGRISVELELRDGQFTARFRNASNTLNQFGNQLNIIDRRMGNVERSVSGFLPKLRDISVISLAAHSAFKVLDGTLGEFAKSIVKANAEMERLNVLLQGLSKADTQQGRIKQAAEEMKFLVDTAQRAPFSLKEMSNSFVKMQSAGLDKVGDKLNNLTNAIARFGGDDQVLHRATIAIQQMASKGVISMEELRQQLGEAVPNAMNLMADGLDMSMQDMVKAISEGKVRAVPAIEAMMSEMDRTMSGSSLRMMDTWNGLISQMETKWTLLRVTIGDAGFFDAAKDGLRDIIHLMESDAALRFAQATGDALKSAIELTKSAANFTNEYGSAIWGAAKAALSLYAGFKLMSGATAVFGFLKGFRNIGLVAELTAAAAATRVVTERFGLMNLQIRQVTTVVPLLQRVTGVMSVLAGGPWWALIIGAVAAGTAAYQLFSDKANESLDKVKNSLRELKENGEIKVKLVTQAQIDEAKTGIMDLKKERDSLQKELARLENTKAIDPSVSLSQYIEQTQALKERLTQVQQEIVNSEQNTADSQVEIIKRASQRKLSEESKSLERAMASFNQHYQERMDIARKQRDTEIEIAKAAGEDTKEIEDKFKQDHIAAARELYEARLVEARKASDQYKVELEKMVGDSEGLKTLLNIKSEIRVEMTNHDELLTNIDKLKVAIANAAPEDKLNLKQRLEENNEKLKESEKRLEDFKRQMDRVMENPIDDRIIDVNSIADAFNLAEGYISSLMSSINNLNNTKVSPVMDFSGLEEQKKKLESLRDMAIQLENKQAEVLAEGESMGQGFVAKQMQRVGGILGDEAVSQASRLFGQFEAGNKAAKETTDLMTQHIQKTAETIQGQQDLNKAKERTLELEKQAANKEAQLAHLKDPTKSKHGSLSIELEETRKRLEASKVPAKEIEETLNRMAAAGAKVDKMEFGAESFRKSQQEAKKAASEAESARKKAQREAAQLARQEERDLKNRNKWYADQMFQMDQAITQARIAGIQDGVIAERESVNARIVELRRLAEAQAEYNGLGKKGKEAEKKAFVDKFVDVGAQKLQEQRSLEQHNDYVERIRTIGEDIFQARNALMEESFDKERIALEHRFDVMEQEAVREISNEQQKQEVLRRLREQEAVEMALLVKSHRTSLEELIISVQDWRRYLVEGMSDIAVNGIDSLAGSLAELATSGKANFREFAISMLKDIEKLILKLLILMAIQKAIGWIMGSAGSGDTGGSLGTYGSMSDAFSGTSIATNAKGGIMPMKTFAQGGLSDDKLAKQLASASMMSSSDMSKGGVKNSPQLALFAEASMPEAFIPLKDGKNVPLRVFRDKDGNLVADIPLPSGQILPTKIIDGGVKAFANGGVMGLFGGDSAQSHNIGGQELQSSRVVDLLFKIDSTLTAMNGKMSQRSLFESVSPIPNINMSHANRNASGEQMGMTEVRAPRQGDTITVPVTINDYSGGGNNSGAGDDKSSKEMWGKMEGRIKEVVTAEIVKQKRPGGILWSGR